jgi:acyl-CoA thioesterase II
MIHRFNDLLAFTPIGDDRFRAEPSVGSGFLYGGLTMGVATVVAGATVDPGMVPLALRSSFVTFGEWGPLDVGVERVNTSRSFAGRRLTIAQGQRLVAAVEVAFHRPEEGVDRQGAAMPEVPAPEELEPMATPLGGVHVIDLRPTRPTGGRPTGRIHPYWCRASDEVGDHPLAHAAALAFMSDYMVIYSPFEPGAEEMAGVQSFTLEHSLWFHRPFSADRWLLFDAMPLSQSQGRFVSRGTVLDAGGGLVASFVQEGFVRPVS